MMAVTIIPWEAASLLLSAKTASTPLFTYLLARPLSMARRPLERRWPRGEGGALAYTYSELVPVRVSTQASQTKFEYHESRDLYM